MIYFKKFFALVALLLMASPSFAQSDFALDVEQSVSGDTLYMDFYIQKTNGPDFPLGSSNFAVTVSEENLDLTKMTKVETGPWDVNHDFQSYLDMGLGGNTFINLSVKRNTSGDGDGQLVTDEKTLIGRVGVPVTNPCGTNTSKWIKEPVAITDYQDNSIKPDAQFKDVEQEVNLCSTPDQPEVRSSAGNKICEGDPLELETPYDGQLQWYYNGMPISNGNTKSITVQNAGKYSVKAINCNCSNLSEDFKVEVQELPDQPLVFQQNDTLFSTKAENYQWTRNGQPIASANNSYFVPQQSGTYRVETQSACGKVTSPAHQFVITGIGDRSGSISLDNFPNPFTEQTDIVLELPEGGNIDVSVFDMTGKMVTNLYHGNASPGTNRITWEAGNSVAAGTYLLKVTIEEKVYTRRLQKTQ